MFAENDKELPMAGMRIWYCRWFRADTKGVAVGGTTRPLVTRFALGSHSCEVFAGEMSMRFLVADVAVFDHEVVQTAVFVRHQVVHDEKPKRA